MSRPATSIRKSAPGWTTCWSRWPTGPCGRSRLPASRTASWPRSRFSPRPAALSWTGPSAPLPPRAPWGFPGSRRPTLSPDAAGPDAAAPDRAAPDAPDPDAPAPPHVVPFRQRRAILAVIGFIGLAAAVAAVVGLAIGLGGGTKRLTYHAALGGTALAPGASGQVTLVQTVSGWQVTLHAKGLPRLDNGQFYQAWLKNQAGILVPIGTFNQPNDVTLWSGVPPTQFPVITVTRQKANGNLSSSGQRVLTGTAHVG